MAAGCALAVAAPAHAAPTAVSIEFDDGARDQYVTRSMLAARGMHATFYVNSGLVGSGSYYMSWAQVRDLYRDGNEIGGHTVNHTDLRGLAADAQRDAVCDDRAALIARGFNPTEFAYPYGRFDASAQQVVRECGYRSGRGVTGIRSPSSCRSCPVAEAIPPLNPFATRTPVNVEATTTLEALQQQVKQAEFDGGWLQIVFHRVCDACTDRWRTTPALFEAFLDWLQPRAAHGTVVRTAQRVMAGTAFEAAPPPPSTTEVVVTSPADGSVTSESSPVIAGTAGDSAAASPDITVMLFPGSDASAAPQQTLTASRTGTSWTITPAPLAPGHWTVVAEQEDADAGVRTSTPVTFRVTAVPAADPPPATNAGERPPAPGPDPGVAPVAAAVADRTGPTITRLGISTPLRGGRLSFSGLISSRGAVAVMTLDEPARVDGSLILDDTRAARRLRIPAGTAVRATARLRAREQGRHRMRFRLPPRLRRRLATALRGANTLRVRLQLYAVDDAGNGTATTRTLVLKRKPSRRVRHAPPAG